MWEEEEVHREVGGDTGRRGAGASLQDTEGAVRALVSP